MKLSDGEKLILYMVSEIADQVGVKSGVNTKLVREAIGGGHLWALKWGLPGVFAEDVPEEVVNEVVDILDMWSMIEFGYEKLSAEEKEQLASQVEHWGTNPKFPGFDGNNESTHMSVARMLIEEMDRFSSLPGYLNSHSPSLDGYRRMLAVYSPIRAGLAGRGMSVNELAAVLSERTHPSNR